MVRNHRQEKHVRLTSKTVDAQLSRAVRQGLNCSPFEAEAIVKLARSVYEPDTHTPGTLKPGQMLLTIISELEGARRKIREATMVRVTITVDAPDDVAIRMTHGVEALRRHRIVRVCQEALAQGGLMTVEDLAHRIFNVGERTVVRDLAALRRGSVIVPLRSTIRDIGRTVSHKEEIIRLWLAGKQYGTIARAAHHSLQAVRRYVETFKRTVALSQEGHTTASIAFLVGASPTLVAAYLALWRKQRDTAIPARVQEVETPFPYGNQRKSHPAVVPAKKGGGRA